MMAVVAGAAGNGMVYDVIIMRSERRKKLVIIAQQFFMPSHSFPSLPHFLCALVLVGAY
jgi:hypothetical protein